VQKFSRNSIALGAGWGARISVGGRLVPSLREFVKKTDGCVQAWKAFLGAACCSEDCAYSRFRRIFWTGLGKRK